MSMKPIIKKELPKRKTTYREARAQMSQIMKQAQIDHEISQKAHTLYQGLCAVRHARQAKFCSTAAAEQFAKFLEKNLEKYSAGKNRMLMHLFGDGEIRVSVLGLERAIQNLRNQTLIAPAADAKPHLDMTNRLLEVKGRNAFIPLTRETANTLIDFYKGLIKYTVGKEHWSAMNTPELMPRPR